MDTVNDLLESVYLNGQMEELGSEDLESVLSRLADLRNVYTPSRASDNSRLGSLVEINESLQRDIEAAYRALLFCELDGDRMLRRRLDLVRAFGFPHYADLIYTQLPRELGVDALHRVFDSASALDQSEQFARFYSVKLTLIDALSIDLGRTDIVKFLVAKKNLDDWIARTLDQVDGSEFVTADGLTAFRNLANRIRTEDKMTAPGTELGVELEKARRDVKEIDALKAAVQAAAGQTADAALSTHFAADAKSDSRIAAQLSWAALGALLPAVAVGAWVVRDLETIGLVEEIAKLTITLPFLGMSAYAGRLSSHYRESARWAKTASVQLKTIDAFTQGVVDAEARDEMKMVLGRRIFGDPGLGNHGKNPDIDELVALVEAIGNAVKAKE